jgi:hypothetical protein
MPFISFEKIGFHSRKLRSPGKCEWRRCHEEDEENEEDEEDKEDEGSLLG